jgi:hypothetical protein
MGGLEASFKNDRAAAVDYKKKETKDYFIVMDVVLCALLLGRRESGERRWRSRG